MGKERPFGKCRICGETRKLTFEHVPPAATYNKHSVRMVSLMELVKTEKQMNAMPWELDKVKGVISQKGKGGYYICEECNNNTGSWYGSHYKRFLDVLMYVYQTYHNRDFKSVSIELKEMRPLPIIKQILVMSV